MYFCILKLIWVSSPCTRSCLFYSVTTVYPQYLVPHMEKEDPKKRSRKVHPRGFSLSELVLMLQMQRSSIIRLEREVPQPLRHAEMVPVGPRREVVRLGALAAHVL